MIGLVSRQEGCPLSLDQSNYHQKMCERSFLESTESQAILISPVIDDFTAGKP